MYGPVVSARSPVPMYGVPSGIHMQAVLGDTHAHAHWRTTVRVRCLLQTLHAEIDTQHSQAHSYWYGQ